LGDHLAAGGHGGEGRPRRERRPLVRSQRGLVGLEGRGDRGDLGLGLVGSLSAVLLGRGQPSGRLLEGGLVVKIGLAVSGDPGLCLGDRLLVGDAGRRRARPRGHHAVGRLPCLSGGKARLVLLQLRLVGRDARPGRVHGRAGLGDGLGAGGGSVGDGRLVGAEG
jgi:hypothetical protein